MTEQELLTLLWNATAEYADASRTLTEAKKSFIAAETLAVNCKINKEKIEEQLRIFRNITPKHEPTAHELEIIKFREAFPELCNEARARDLSK